MYLVSGATLGTGLQSMYAGFVANSLGWEYIFYINGILGIVWCVFYFFLGSSSPAEHKSISKAERMYIERSTATTSQEKVGLPTLTDGIFLHRLDIKNLLDIDVFIPKPLLIYYAACTC